MGRVKVKFAEKNKFGVLDHDVTLPSGVKVYNPIRVFPNNDGSELVFTLYRRPDLSDQEFVEDAKAVEKDLAKLKTVVENKFPSIKRNPHSLNSPTPWIGVAAKGDRTAVFIEEPDYDEDLEDFRSSACRGDPFV